VTTHPTAQPKAHRSRRRLAFLPVLIGIVALAGCGSSSKSSSSASTPETPAASTPSTSSSTASTTPAPAAGGAGSSLSLAANPEGQLAYNTKSLTAKAGKVSIAFTNAAPLAHNLSVETSSGQTVGATPTFQGGSKTLSLNLKPGTYKFFCIVPGRRQAGMEGTLTVK
jgi:plastocyanin